jgi:hypothetical protein
VTTGGGDLSFTILSLFLAKENKLIDSVGEYTLMFKILVLAIPVTGLGSL